MSLSVVDCDSVQRIDIRDHVDDRCFVDECGHQRAHGGAMNVVCVRAAASVAVVVELRYEIPVVLAG